MKNIIICVSIFLVSCSSGKYIETSLYFGQSKPGGTMLTEKEWAHFKTEYISKVFKEGSSVVAVNGNWRGTATHQLITDPSYAVSYHHKKSELLNREIDSLCYCYKTLYNQQSVLKVSRRVDVKF
jgi:hypothetical protein